MIGCEGAAKNHWLTHLLYCEGCAVYWWLKQDIWQLIIMILKYIIINNYEFN